MTGERWKQRRKCSIPWCGCGAVRDGMCDACHRRASEDNASIAADPAFVGTVDEFERYIAQLDEVTP